MSAYELDGKVALVTGASRGVGAAIAVALAEAGASVACAARSTADAPQRTPGTLDDTVARVNEAGRRRWRCRRTWPRQRRSRPWSSGRWRTSGASTC